MIGCATTLCPHASPSAAQRTVRWSPSVVTALTSVTGTWLPRNGWTGTRGTFGRARSASRTVRRESRVCSVTRCRRDGRGTSVWVLHVCVQPRCFAATTVEYKYAVLNAEGGARWEVRAEVRRLCGRTGGRIRSSPCFVCVAVWCVCVGVCWCVCWWVSLWPGVSALS